MIKHQTARETLEDQRQDGANPWKLVRNRLKAYLQEEEDDDELLCTYLHTTSSGIPIIKF